MTFQAPPDEDRSDPRLEIRRRVRPGGIATVEQPEKDRDRDRPEGLPIPNPRIEWRHREAQRVLWAIPSSNGSTTGCRFDPLPAPGCRE
jgi:hypothetical protein